MASSRRVLSSSKARSRPFSAACSVRSRIWISSVARRKPRSWLRCPLCVRSCAAAQKPPAASASPRRERSNGATALTAQRRARGALCCRVICTERSTNCASSTTSSVKKGRWREMNACTNSGASGERGGTGRVASGDRISSSVSEAILAPALEKARCSPVACSLSTLGASGIGTSTAI